MEYRRDIPLEKIFTRDNYLSLNIQSVTKKDMAEATPLLSIVMPTRNRMECARHAIANILRFEETDFELVVQDNSENDELSKWIDGQPFDSRLHYEHVQKRASISRNFERAVERSRGRFLCCLGDDDGLNACVIQLTRWIEEHEIDALVSTSCAHYFWPGIVCRDEEDKSSGRLVLSPYQGRTDFCDPAKELDKCVRAGGATLYGLPRIYHGVVRRRCIDEVKQQTGYYMPGVSPDMAASIALTFHVNRIIRVDYPVFVPGASQTSGAGRGVQKTHHGELSREGFLDQGFVARWPRGVPAFFSGPTMWGAAVIQALEATGNQEVLKKFNLVSLHATCAVFVPSRFAETIKSFRRVVAKGNAIKSVAWARFGVAYFVQWIRRLRRLLFRYTLVTFTEDSERLSNIDDAMVFLKEELASKSPPILEDLPVHNERNELELLQVEVGSMTIRGEEAIQKRISA